MNARLRKSVAPTEWIPPERYTRIGVIHHLPQVLAEFGVDATEVLESEGIAPDIFDDLENKIELAAMQNLLVACERVTRNDYITHLICRHTRLADFGLAGRAALCGATAGEGLLSFAAHFNLHNTVTTVSLIEDGNFARYSYAISIGGMPGSDQIQLGAVTIAYNVLQDLLGRQWTPAVITFAARAPSDLRPLTQFFRCPLRFDSGESAVIFYRHWLNQARPEVTPEFRRQVDAEIRARRAELHADLPATVSRVLRKQLLLGRCDMDEIAGMLGMHRRTLDRQLQKRGVRFGELADTVKGETARLLLRDTGMQVQQIAETLNFSSPANFATAFRRWTGLTPSEYRRRRA